MDGDRPFSHRRGHALHITRTNIANRKHRRKTSFQHLRSATERPGESWSDLRNYIQVSSSQDESLVVESNTPFEPLGSWRCPSHDENMANVMSGGFTGDPVKPGDALQQSVTLQADNFRLAMQFDCRIVSNPLNQVTRHGVRQLRAH